MSIVILTAVFIAVTYLFGFLYAAISSYNKRYMIAAIGWTGFCVLGFVGVPFHELSHLVTALIFKHKITDVALFRPVKGKTDGNLGYVHHSYNKKSLYQQIGNFFIGAAPMLFGSIVLLILFYLSVPFNINNFVSKDALVLDFGHIVLGFGTKLVQFDFFSWLTVAVAFLICPHLGMSKADFKNTAAGVAFLIVLSCIFAFVTGIKRSILNVIYFDFIVRYIYILIIGLLISIFVMMISKICSINVSRRL